METLNQQSTSQRSNVRTTPGSSLNQFGALERSHSDDTREFLVVLSVGTLLWTAVTVSLFLFISSRVPGMVWMVLSLSWVGWFILTSMSGGSRPAVLGGEDATDRYDDSHNGWKLARGTLDNPPVLSDRVGIVRRVRRKTNEFLSLAAMKARGRR